MLDSQLRLQLSSVAARIRRLWMWKRLTGAWVGLSVLMIIWAFVGRPILPFWSWFATATLVGIFVWLRSRTTVTSKTEVARRIEQTFPDLNSRLLAALEQQPDVQTGRLNVLQRQVISEAVHHSRMNDWGDSVPRAQIAKAFFGQVAALIAFVGVGIVAMQYSSKSASATIHTAATSQVSQSEVSVSVEPGNVELERGSSLLVLARFKGSPPADVHVIWKPKDQPEQRSLLTKSLDDPIFATRLPSLKDDITYCIDFDGRQTEEFQVTLYDLPALVRSDLRMRFPEYTNLPENVLEDAFETTVVEGTQVTIVCRLNKQVASAKLVAKDGTAIQLQPDPADSTIRKIDISPTKSLRLKLDLTDDAGRKNRDPEEFRIDVVPNRVPDLALAFPGKDVKVSPLEEMLIEATTIDDFGILEAGLVFQVAGRDPATLRLAKDLKGSERHKMSSIERLEEFRAQPDELVSYYLYAIDYGPDGKKRETSSDVFFAEVRSFDEIFRQMDQQSPLEVQSQQKPPDSLGKLIELQRQIVVATWKLARTPSAAFTAKADEDIGTILESQQQALQKLQDLRERMTQPQLQPIFSTIKDAMEDAVKKLAQSSSEKSLAALRPAVASEQASYQALLKLRAKEHMLVQSRGKGNSSESEEKLDLELKENKDRYESEKAGAKKEESNVNREALAILDRLKDLSRRQDGVNQQLKELESQIRQAKSDAEREEMERQLKRLREEQQQLLHDADELRNKLNKSMQQETVAETKEKLEQTRQRMVETAEKLREGQLSQALNAGTRAERELKQLADDFRKQTAAQFADALRSLREDVRRLAEREKQLGEQLTHLDDESRHSLRGSQERAQLQSEFRGVQQQMNEITDRSKQIVEQSESSEPLLSKQLYDTLRSARDLKLDQALNATQQLLKQGVIPEAAKAEQQAQKGIDQLKQGIEKAAESVLGNEVDSLKRARRELADLSQQLDREIQANGGSKSEDQKASNGKSSQPKLRDEGASQSDPSNGEPSDAGKDSNASGNQSDSNSPSKSPSSKPGKENGQSGSGGDGQGEPDPNGDASAPDPGASQGNGSSNGSAQNGRPSERRAPSGLRPRKPNAASRPEPGREDDGGEESGGGGSAGNSQGSGPLTGSDFTEFNERLRDVESMVSDPQLQAEVQKVRDRARSVRAEFKRHTNTPNWELVRTSVHQPMLELQQRLADEIAKRESPDSLVPVDRDPVPNRYRDLVRLYYERLGSGKNDE